MSQFTSLIERTCPTGVPYLPLSDLLQYEQPTKYLVKSTDYSHEYSTPVLTAGRTFVLGYTEETGGIYEASDSAPVLIFDDFTTAFKWVDFPFKAKSSAMKILKVRRPGTADLRYVFYAMQSIRYTPQDHARQWIATYSTFRIPLPPLEVQREIVQMLDKFTHLKAELEAELGARDEQRLALAGNFAVLSRDEPEAMAQIELVALGSIAKESVVPVKIQPGHSYTSLGVKWNGEGVLVRDPKDGATIKANTLYRARAGQLIYNRMFVVEGSFALVPAACENAVVSGEFPLFDLDATRVDPYWLLNYLTDPYTLKRIEGEVTGTERGTMKSRRRWKSNQFNAFKVPLPTIETQREIVRALKASEHLIQSLQEEIGARHKQYEYYRDRLLAIEEAVV